MILVDTSVWIDHFRKGESSLIELLESNQVLMHPFICGELACGNLQNGTVILRMLRDLPLAMVADDNEVQRFIERHQIMGSGIGYVDAHLLAATALNTPAKIWTRDRTLQAVAVKLELSF
jgi:predicted nucleic acid-binding protein